MTIAQARAVLTDAGRNVTAATNDETNLDYAIQAAGNEFVSRTKCLVVYDTILIASPTSNLVDGDWASDFRPDRLLRAWVITTNDDRADLQVVPYVDLLAMHAEDSTEGVPTQLAFQSTSDNTSKLWREPDAAFTIHYQYYAPFTEYTAGVTGSGANDPLNIPEDMIRPVINCGAVYYLLKNMPEHADWVDRCRRDFEQHIKNHAFRAGTGVRSTTRAMLA